MHDGAPAFLFERLPGAGIAAIRFNFRGVGASGGVHDRGNAERLDLGAAIDALAGVVPGVPLVVCGWSFGADVSLCVDDARIDAWCAIAPPLSIVPVEEMRAPTDPRHKHLLIPEHDQYNAPPRATTITAPWINTTIEVLPGTDHFLGGALERVLEALAVLTRSLLI
jgi:alpha/beta superfamily hydrolase